MLGSVFGRLYRGLVGRLPGIDTLVAERIAQRQAADTPLSPPGDLAAFLRFGAEPRTTLDIEQTAYWLASVSSAQYFLQHMRMAQNLREPESLLRFALEQCAVEGLVLEFGVYQGNSLRIIAECVDGPVYGFDSFEGLPEDWTHYQRKGRFSLEGRLPRFEQPNVHLVPGWFEETLPGFLATHPGPARFIHVDSDLYRSAATVLTHLAPRMTRGTLILFDEYLNYPGWEHHEFRAFQEFIQASGRSYEYLGFASSYHSAAVRLT
jgi:hypothetical protein